MLQTLFIHIPRTAGRSINQHAKKYAPDYGRVRKSPVTYRNSNHAETFVYARHVGVGWLLKHKGISREWYRECFRFAFVRNPWDRLVSVYKFYRSFRMSRDQSLEVNRCVRSFDLFVRTVISGKYLRPLHAIPGKNWLALAHPQTEWLQWGVDFVGRFERLDEDWRRLCNVIGLHYEALQKTHVLLGRPWREWYTEELRSMVADFYAEEIERFEYTFD